jgi:hypothetical protein
MFDAEINLLASLGILKRDDIARYNINYRSQVLPWAQL